MAGSTSYLMCFFLDHVELQGQQPRHLYTGVVVHTQLLHTCTEITTTTSPAPKLDVTWSLG
jgi:hypothetical protein